MLLWVATASAQTSSRSTELTEASFPAVLASILPKPSEDQWRQISWRPDLGAALREARNQGKPILLWAMNGQPCGMT